MSAKKINYRDLVINDKSRLSSIIESVLFWDNKDKEIRNIFNTERLWIDDINKSFIGFMKNFHSKDTTKRQNKKIVKILNKTFDFDGYDVNAMIYQSDYKLG